jgi:antitoxin component of RelBE/YafQ-DinJ toxin-antitoxin module
MAQDQIISFRADKAFHDRICRFVTARHMSVSDFIRTVLAQVIEAEEARARLEAAKSQIHWDW